MRTVAIVDDEPVTRMDLCGMLEELGFSIAGQASDGFDAIELCRRTHPDVVLMDMRMPVFDGLTAAETICREDLAGCVIMLTAFSDRDAVMRAAAAGVTGYLVKPIDPQKLLPTMEVAFAQAQRLRESRQRAENAERKMREDRLIHKAQKILARAQNCSEADTYAAMRKMAMNKRVSIASIAQAIVEQEERGK